MDPSLGVFTGLAPGITPLGVDVLLYCFAEDDEGVIYKMGYRRRRGRQREGRRRLPGQSVTHGGGGVL